MVSEATSSNVLPSSTVSMYNSTTPSVGTATMTPLSLVTATDTVSETTLTEVTENQSELLSYDITEDAVTEYMYRGPQVAINIPVNGAYI